MDTILPDNRTASSRGAQESSDERREIAIAQTATELFCAWGVPRGAVTPEQARDRAEMAAELYALAAKAAQR